MSFLGSKHQGSLVLLIERDTVTAAAIVLVPCFQKHLDDGEVAQRACQMQVGVGQPQGTGVGVLEQVRVGFQDAAHEQRVVVVDGSTETEGGIDPGEIQSVKLVRVSR